jgi:hypothetical protein
MSGPITQLPHTFSWRVLSYAQRNSISLHLAVLWAMTQLSPTSPYVVTTHKNITFPLVKTYNVIKKFYIVLCSGIYVPRFV